MLKITGIQTIVEQIPVDPPVRTAIHDIHSVDTVVLQVSTSDPAIVGRSYVFAFGLHRANALRELVLDLADVVRDQDPREVRRLWQRMWASINFMGHKGAHMMALSGVDIALWDLVGRCYDAPVFRLLGGSADPLPVYASGGLYHDQTTDKMRSDLAFFIGEGFRAVKMRVGAARVEEDLERLALVREVLGPDRLVLADANQGWDRTQAEAFCRGVDAGSLYWLEEPFPFDDRDSYRWLAGRTSVPITAGETEYSRFGVRDWLDTGIRYFMPDIARIGGVTEWIRAADLLSTHGIKVAPHLYFEHSVPLMAAAPNGAIVEEMRNPASERTDALFENPLRSRDGYVSPIEEPGFGMVYKPHILDRLDEQRGREKEPA